ncbi:MAG: hypothetical protein O2861_16145 [Proteobacteria bacterium]|nr:hypothetical protein [Pseudomonadota bacterium]
MSVAAILTDNGTDEKQEKALATTTVFVYSISASPIQAPDSLDVLPDPLKRARSRWHLAGMHRLIQLAQKEIPL